jgi:HlyD family secretion protein
MKRWMWGLVALVVIVGGFFGWRAIRRAQEAANLNNLETVTLSTGPLTAKVGATGSVRANQLATLSFSTSGTVDAVLAGVGDSVDVDQELATLKQTSLPSNVILAQADLVDAQRALDQLQTSDLARAQAQLALAQARETLDDAQYQWTLNQEGNRALPWTLKGARAQVVLAEKRLEKTRNLFEKTHGKLSRARAQLALTDARRAYEQAVWRLDWLESGADEIDQAVLTAKVEQAQASLSDAQDEWERVKDGPDPEDLRAAEARVAAAQASLELAHIAAPFAGTITRAQVMPGDQVSPGSAAFELSDLSRLIVDVEIPEIDINKIQAGQDVELDFDAILDNTYHGKVTSVALTGTDVQGLVNYDVEVELVDADERVKPGMTAAVNIIVEQLQDVLLIPNRAVRVSDGEQVVYRLEGGVPAAVPVVLGASSETDSQLISGDLRAGDSILLNPPSNIFDFSGPPPFAR